MIDSISTLAMAHNRRPDKTPGLLDLSPLLDHRNISHIETTFAPTVDHVPPFAPDSSRVVHGAEVSTSVGPLPFESHLFLISSLNYSTRTHRWRSSVQRSD